MGYPRSRPWLVLAVVGLGALLCLATARARPVAGGGGPVLFFGHDAVAAAFARSADLVPGAPGRNYKVLASRRNGPGEVEVHAQDTDVVYVVSGRATFVTGGTLAGGRPTAPGETRGGRLAGGEVHELAPGDLVVVPHGTPHWFRAVPGPFTYLTVKIR